MKRWATMQLGDVCIAKSGNSKIIKGTLPTKNDGTLFPAYSATGQDVFSEGFDFEVPGIVISAVGARCGKCFLANGKWRAIANTHVILPKPDKTNVRFLWYLLNDELFWVKGGTAQPFVKVGDSLKKQIVLPPLEEQERIVKLLDEADALRKLRAQADQRTANLIPALFHEMFGDTNRPKFEKKRLDELIKLKSGEFLPAKSMTEGGRHPVYGGNGISGYHDAYLFNERKVVIGRVGYYCGAVHFTEPQSWITDNALYVAEKDAGIIDEYLVEALRVLDLKQYAGQAAQPLVSGSRIYPLEIPVPPRKIQEFFAERVREIRELEVEQAASRAKLDSLFQSMLHRAFRGEL